MRPGGVHVNINSVQLQLKSQSAANLILIPCKIEFELFGETML